jgi:hypothetical protein
MCLQGQQLLPLLPLMHRQLPPASLLRKAVMELSWKLKLTKSSSNHLC